MGGLEADSDHDKQIAPPYLSQYSFRATPSGAILAACYQKPEHMPSITPPTELDQLVALIAAQPDGLGIDAIAKLQGNRLAHRTLQRRLALLAKQGRIQMLGEARAVRYVCTSQVNKGFASIRAPMPTLQATGEVYVPVSPEGEEIKAYVRQHRAMRAPVGYRQAFLEQYHPNHTA